MKAKLVSLLVLTTMLLGMLAACGPESATNTPIPPSPTPVPPTNTAAPAATNTTGAGAVPTPSDSGGTGQGTAATAADMALIMEALTNTRELKTYEFNMEISGDIITQTTKADGKYADGRTHANVTQGPVTSEYLAADGKNYMLVNGQWVEQAEDAGGGGGLLDPSSLARSPNPLETLDSLNEAGSNFRDTGQDETINGVKTRHFTYDLDINKLMGSGDTSDTPPEMMDAIARLGKLGGGDMWIDPSAKQLHRLTMRLDFAKVLELMTLAFSMLGGTPTPGGTPPTPTPPINIDVKIDISKHNDSSITVPEPPAGSTAEPTATSELMAPESTPTEESSLLESTPTASTGSTGSPGQTYQVGDTATVGGLEITVNSAKTVEATDFFEPDAGMKFVAIDVTFKNPTSSAIPVSSLLMTEMQDSTGKTYDLDISATVATGASQPDGDVAAGGELTGPFGYQIPEDATGLKWIFKEYPEDEQAVFEVNP